MTDPNNALSGATDFLHLFGHVILGYLWSQIAEKSFTKIDQKCNTDFYKAKLITGKFYMKRALPETRLRLERVLSGKGSVMDLEQNYF